MIGIYKITNNINGKYYIGQSIDIDRRWYDHKYKAFNKNDISYNSAIHSAMRKYGLKNFTLSIIEECQEEDLDKKERYWINQLNSLVPNGYNILEGGQLNRSYATFCKKCGKQISKYSEYCSDCKAFHQRKVTERPSDLELAKLVKENGFEGTGRIFGVSGNTIKKWCLSCGIPSLKKDLISWYNNKMGIVQDKKSFKRRVVQIDSKTNQILGEYESANSAARALGKEKGNHISEVCNGKLKQAYGFLWKYKE
jgi:group I intron endonuclease